MEVTATAEPATGGGSAAHRADGQTVGTGSRRLGAPGRLTRSLTRPGRALPRCHGPVTRGPGSAASLESELGPSLIHCRSEAQRLAGHATVTSKFSDGPWPRHTGTVAA